MLNTFSLVEASAVTNNEVYERGQRFFFGDIRNVAQCQALVEKSRDFCNLKCRIVSNRDAFAGLFSSTMEHRDQILLACVGLLSRPAMTLGDVSRVEQNFPTIVKLIGKPLRKHAKDLDDLRDRLPVIFRATMEGQIAEAWAATTAIRDRTRRHEVGAIIARHWMLICASDLQRGAAYIVSSRRSPIPRLFSRVIGVADITVSGILFVAISLAATSEAYARNYLKPLRRVNEDVVGARSNPVSYLRAILKQWWPNVNPQRRIEL